MMNKLSKEQLAKLVTHAMSISNILLEAHSPEQEDEPLPQTYAHESEEVFHDELLDAICGRWCGKGRKQPDLMIHQTATGYMAVYGRMDKKKQLYPDLFNLHREKEYVWFDNGDERVYISHHEGSDTLTLSPGGEYDRMPEKK